MEEKRRNAEPLDAHAPDACLAATATSRWLALVTRNMSEFHNTGVKTVNLQTVGPR